MWWTGRLGPSGLVGVGMQAPSMGQAGSDSGHTGLAGGVSVGDEEKEIKEIIAKINKTKSWFFEVINKTDKPLAKLIKKKGIKI